MSFWTPQHVSPALTHPCTGLWKAQRVTTDSRALQPGDLFVALIGDTFDGHQFVAQALAQGAVAAIVSRIPEDCDVTDERLLRVEDTLLALQKLGQVARRESPAKFIGVTGSVGKTSCKEALLIAFSGQSNAYATTGNLNNHIGLPLTLANMPQETEIAILEMGMNHAGEIDVLSKIGQPHAAIITAVEAVHIEFFENGLEGIADAKSEIAAGLVRGGTLVLPADNHYISRLKDNARRYGVEQVLTFGEHSPSADYRLMEYEVAALGSRLVVMSPNGAREVRLGTVGRHWALMACGVLALVDALGYDSAQAAQALAQFTEPAGRGRMQEVSLSGGRQVFILDDSYNASPASIRAALSRMDEIWRARGCRGRKLAALGDMRELGVHSETLHRELAPELERYGVDALFAAGEQMQHLYKTLSRERQGGWATEASLLADVVVEALQDGDLLLIKGSRGSRMDKVVTAVLSAKEDSASLKVRHAL